MSEPITIERQIAAVRREVSMRRRVYPRWIASGKMSQDQADREIEAMVAAQATLEQLRTERQAVETPGLF